MCFLGEVSSTSFYSTILIWLPPRFLSQPFLQSNHHVCPPPPSTADPPFSPSPTIQALATLLLPRENFSVMCMVLGEPEVAVDSSGTPRAEGKRRQGV